MNDATVPDGSPATGFSQIRRGGVPEGLGIKNIILLRRVEHFHLDVKNILLLNSGCFGNSIATVFVKFHPATHYLKRKMSLSPVGDEMEGIEIENMPLMTEEEKRVLEVYDRLEGLQLEIALLKAQGVLSQGKSILSF